MEAVMMDQHEIYVEPRWADDLDRRDESAENFWLVVFALAVTVLAAVILLG